MKNTSPFVRFMTAQTEIEKLKAEALRLCDEAARLNRAWKLTEAAAKFVEAKAKDQRIDELITAMIWPPLEVRAKGAGK